LAADTPTDGNSTDEASTLLAELESLLQTFPEIQHDKILQHLHSLEPMSYLALDNSGDTLTQSQMLCADDKQKFLDAETDEINGLLKMNAWNIAGYLHFRKVLKSLTVFGPITASAPLMATSSNTKPAYVPMASSNNMALTILNPMPW